MMMIRVAFLAAASAAFVPGGAALGSDPTPFAAGARDRVVLESWLTSLAGDYRLGAEYWTAHRSDSSDATCRGGAAMLQGCLAARQLIAPFDRRRRSEPDYRSGWNSVPDLPQAAAAPPRGATMAATPPPPPRIDGRGAGGGAFPGGTLLLGGIGVFLAYRASLVWRKRSRRAAALRLAMREIRDQARRLHIRKEQLTQPDFYGTRGMDRWEKEKRRFLDTRIAPILAQAGLTQCADYVAPRALVAMEDAADRAPEPEALRPVSDPRVYSPSMLPTDYELYCAIQLRKAGWSTSSTPRTGDQGADVLAERDGLVLVGQCKLYSGSVGNGAVQEAAAARQFYKADLAVVVSNARYTNAARQLAGMSDVTLLHHDELAGFVGPTHRPTLASARADRPPLAG